MGTIADKLSAALDSKAAMQDAMHQSCPYIALGDVLSEWPDDMRHTRISGDLEEYKCYMNFAGKGTTVAQRQATAPYQMRITDLDIDFENTTFSNYSFYAAFTCSPYLSSITQPFKPKVTKVTTNPTYVFGYAFQACDSLSGEISVDFTEACDYNGAAVTNLANSMFISCANISGVTLTFPDTLVGSSLDSVYAANMFKYCTNLQHVTINGLSTNSKYNGSAPSMFTDNPNLTSITYTNVRKAYQDYDTPTIIYASSGQNWFSSTLTSLNTVNFPALEILNIGGTATAGIVNQSMFGYVKSSLRHIYLPKCYNIANGAFHELTCTVHLSESNKAALSALPGFEDNFTWKYYNGTPEGNVTLVYDM